MDLTSPLRSLIPSLDSAALGVLATTETAMGLSQIAALAGRGSRPGLARVLDRLVADGLVVATPANRGQLYRFNHDHLLAGAVREALEVRPVLFSRLTEALTRLEPAVVHASVFGSLARGGGGPQSDIDLFVVTRDDLSDDDGWSRQIRALETRVFGWTGNRLEVVELPATHLRHLLAHDAEPLFNSLRAESVTLVGTPFREIANDIVRASTPRRWR